MMKLSIGMMVKNEEKNLERCLQSLQPIRDQIDSELIIVDTGSEDRTVEIAEKYKAQIYFHKWNNDFSEMRNITINYAKGEWFLVIDADEVLENPQSIVDFLKTNNSKKYNAAVLFVKNLTSEDEATDFSTLLMARLFRKNKKFHFEGAVHNQVFFDGPVADLKTYMTHYGYIANDKELMERKFIRTSTILKSELEKEPEHIYYLYQLSVTYGMHGDYQDAIEYIEKAYQVFLKQNKPTSSMFVMTHMVLMYQIIRDFKKVEELCLESLEISDGYIDIYYYLAEAQAIQSKNQEAIENYEKYLALLKNYHNFTEKDGGVIEYSLGNEQLALSNLANLYKQINNLDMALDYAEKISDKKIMQGNLGNIIFLYLKLGKYNELKGYCNRVVEEEEEKFIFYTVLEKVKDDFGDIVKCSVAKAFSDVNDYYGLLSLVIIEEQDGEFSPTTLEKIKKIDFSELPVYCGDILYYLLKMHYPLQNVLIHFKEIWINTLVDDLTKRHDDFSEIIYKYLQQDQPENNIIEYKLSKMLCRYILILNKLDDAKYQEIFNRYINDGICYMNFLYAPCVMENGLVYEVKNDEEVFIIYMYGAQSNKDVHQVQYVQYLRKALQVFPAMKKGIEIFLKEMQSAQTAQNDEFSSYKMQVKASIRNLIDNGKLEEAKSILTEYKNIVSNDMEAILLESKILLKSSS